MLCCCAAGAFNAAKNMIWVGGSPFKYLCSLKLFLMDYKNILSAVVKQINHCPLHSVTQAASL